MKLDPFYRDVGNSGTCGGAENPLVTAPGIVEGDSRVCLGVVAAANGNVNSVKTRWPRYLKCTLVDDRRRIEMDALVVG